MTAPQPPAGSPDPDPLGGSLPGTPGRTTGAGPVTPAPARHTGRTIGRGLALALLLFVTVVLVLFVVFNTQHVDISLVFGDVHAPLVLALLIAAVLGGLVVGLAGVAMRARRNRKAS